MEGAFSNSIIDGQAVADSVQVLHVRLTAEYR
jgi:hypothetical protein